jgi:hypothetical protein
VNRTSEFFIRLNWLITPLLDSRCHGVLSGWLALMKFRGRKSGREFVTPVAYHRFGETILIGLTETRNRQWWRNYRRPWPMTLKVRGDWRAGVAEFQEPGGKEYRAGFEKIFNRHGFIARIMHIDDYRADQGLTDAQLEILLNAGSGLVKFADDEEALRAPIADY